MVCETGKGAELPHIVVGYKQAPLAIGQACNFNEKWVVLQGATQTSRAAK